jgi:hypothetical protein
MYNAVRNKEKSALRKALTKSFLVVIFALPAAISWRACIAQPKSMIKIHKIQLVQSVQDATDSVPLIGGKPTIVRVYLDHSGPPTSVKGRLLVQDASGKTLATLLSGNSINIDSNQTFTQAFASFNRTLNFRLLDRLTLPGTIVLQIKDIQNSQSKQQIACDNCATFSTKYSLLPSVPMRVRIVLLSYWWNGQPVLPQMADALCLQSWLARAYPVSEIQAATEIFQLPKDFDFSCNAANATLAVVRENDVKANMDPRTHVIGLVSNKYDFMIGCSSGVPTDTPDPSIVASAPAGRSNDPPKLVPSNRELGTSKTFADWYGGHELAHTYGRLHPGDCRDNSKDDLHAPKYHGGSIASDAQAFAYDVGDDSQSLKAAKIVIKSKFMRGTQATDLMTYCNQPNWPSVYTYKGLYARLIAEDNNSVKPAAPTFPAATSGPSSFGSPSRLLAPASSAVLTTVAENISSPAPQSAPIAPSAEGKNESFFESIIARLNITQKTGKIVAAISATNAALNNVANSLSSSSESSVTSSGSPILRFRNSAGEVIAQYAPKIKLDSDTKPDSDQLGLIQTSVPRPNNAATLELSFGDTILDKRDIHERPPAVAEVPVHANGARGAGGQKVLQWTASHPGGAPLTYTVQGSRDGKKWMTLAAGLTDPHLTLLAQQQMPWFRVIANDGFNDSEPTIIRSPKTR